MSEQTPPVGMPQASALSQFLDVIRTGSTGEIRAAKLTLAALVEAHQQASYFEAIHRMNDMVTQVVKERTAHLDSPDSIITIFREQGFEVADAPRPARFQVHDQESEPFPDQAGPYPRQAR